MSRNQHILEAHRVVNNPYGFIRAGLDERQRYIGYNCLFVPEEILHAAGCIPVRILGKHTGMDISEKYIPSQCCEFVKNIISSFDKGIFSFLEAAAFGFCCDTMQVASSILKERRLVEIFQLNIPTKFGGESARNYLIKEIDRFRKSVEERLNITIREEALSESTRIYRENDRLLRQLKDFRNTFSESLSASDFLAVLSMGYFIPKETHNAYLKELLKVLTTKDGDFNKPAGSRKKRIILSGFLNNDIDLVRRIENLGVSIVDDDLCEGSRYMSACDESESSPVQVVADRLLSRYCPVKNGFETDYSERLISRYRENAAQGIVIFLYRFCDPQYMEYAMAKPNLADKDIPTLVLEPVIDGDNFKQIETRLEAFIESL